MKQEVRLDRFGIERMEAEAALLEAPSVEECRVLVRETETFGQELVAYVVLSGPFLPEQLSSHLQNLGFNIPCFFVPLSTLPLTEAGLVDEEALTRFYVIDADLIQRWEDQLKLLPGIEQVAVVAQERTESLPRRHLSDLLADWNSVVPREPVMAACEGREADGSSASPKRLAISHGGLLPKRDRRTLTELLQWAAQQKPVKGIVHIQSDGSEIVQSYEELLVEAQRVLAGLRRLGLSPQDQVILQLDVSQDFLPAFWGCVLGGFVPVPLSIPPTYSQLNQSIKKFSNTWQMLTRPIVLTNASLAPAVRSLSNLLDLDNFHVYTIDELRRSEPEQKLHVSQPEDLALLLLTSGSTSLPKGVMLSHNNLLSMSAGFRLMNGFSEQDVTLNWMPLDHVGALVFLSIMAVDLGCQQVHVPTNLILHSPLKWLDLIECHKATISWAPNFAFGLICDHAEEIKRKQWDLSSMRFLVNGEEAIVAKTVRKFLTQLAEHGLSTNAIHPAFGMSETSSIITSSDGFSLESSSDDMSFVELGPPIAGASLRIVDENDQIVPEGTIGHLQVKGASVTSAYYQNPSANQEAFTDDGWFRSGDLGFLSEERLTITGRQKDVIIINGLNYYCHEIEAVVEEVEGVETSYTAACTIRMDDDHSDQLAIFFSLASDSKRYGRESAGTAHSLSQSDERGSAVRDSHLLKLLKHIRHQVVQNIGVNPTYLVPVEKEAIPKTAIGKIQRSQLAKRFLAGEFNDIIKRSDILMENVNTLPEWFYRKVWRRKCPVTLAPTPRQGQYLLFLDQLGLGTFIKAQLHQPNVTVEVGTDFVRLTANRYRINPKEPDHYRRLLRALAADHIQIDHILHLWSYNEYAGEVQSVEALERAQEQGLYTLLFLVQALAEMKPHSIPIQLFVIGSLTQLISPSDKIAYEKASILGFIKTIPAEIHGLTCRHIDLEVERVEVNGAHILQELRLLSGEQEVAYRNGERWVPRLEKVVFSRAEKEALPFKQRGIYMITGGLGGIGVEVAKYLLKHYQARLLLVGRTSLPENGPPPVETPRRGVSTTESYTLLGERGFANWPPGSWQAVQADALSAKIEAYQELAQEGEVIYRAVDVCDLARLKEVVSQETSRWGGQLDGVIHLAGVYKEQTIVDTTRSSLAAVLRPKIFGTWVLHQLLKEQPDTLFINFSSISGFFGGATVGAYSAANSFVDTFSVYQKYNSRLQIADFAWSMWDETGMSRGYELKQLSRALGYMTIEPKQGLYSLLAALHHKQTHLMIGLDGRKQNIQRYQSESVNKQKLTAYFTFTTSHKGSSGVTDHQDELGHLWQYMPHVKQSDITDRFGIASPCELVPLEEMPRTDRGTIDREKLVVMGDPTQRSWEDLLPRTETERQLALLWQELLTVQRVGIHDNFFELGGNSLLATQVIYRVREAFNIKLPLRSMFSEPTVAGLAELIENVRWMAQASSSQSFESTESEEEEGEL